MLDDKGIDAENFVHIYVRIQLENLVFFIQGQMRNQKASCGRPDKQIIAYIFFFDKVLGNAASKCSFAPAARNN
ncbi:hypothetical protein D9M72_547680 [compost metagenome]